MDQRRVLAIKISTKNATFCSLKSVMWPMSSISFQRSLFFLGKIAFALQVIEHINSPTKHVARCFTFE